MHRTETYRLYLSDGWSISLDESLRSGILLSLLLTATGAVEQGILICLGPNLVTSITSIHYQG